MPHPNKRKGDAFERDVRKYLLAHDVPVIRQHDGGINDTGDFVIGPFLAEAKAYRDLAAGIRDALTEAEAATLAYPSLIPVGIVRRPGKAASSALFVVSLSDFVRWWSRYGME